MSNPILSDEAIEYYADHPVEFVEDVIFQGKYRLNKMQATVLNGLTHCNSYTVEEDRLTGKTACIAMAAIWFYVCKPNAKVVCLSRCENSRIVLHKEITKWLNKSILAILFTTTLTTITMKARHWTDGFIQTRVASDAESIQGLCGDYLLVALDDSRLIKDSVLEVAYSTITGKNNVALEIK